MYERYVDDMLSPHGKERLNTLLLREDVIDVLEVVRLLCFLDMVVL